MAYHSGNSLPISLVRAVGQVQRMFREIAIGIAADFDLFLGEMDALMALAESGELRMGDVAKRMSISPTNATRLIKQLEGKGLVRRTRSMASNREVFACLTARGVSVNDDCGPNLDVAFRSRVDAVLSEEERDSLFGYLGRLCDPTDAGGPAH